MSRESMCLRRGSKSFLWASLSGSVCTSISHTIHHHMACLSLKAVFSFSIEVKPEVYASTNSSGPQENSLLHSSKILQHHCPEEWWQGGRPGKDMPILSLPLILQKELVWLVRASHGWEVCGSTDDRIRPVLLWPGQLQLREQKGVAQEQTGDTLGRKEKRGWVPFLLWLDS